MSTQAEQHPTDRFSMMVQIPAEEDQKEQNFMRNGIGYVLLIDGISNCKGKLNVYLWKSNESPNLVDITFGIGPFIRSTLANYNWIDSSGTFNLPRPCPQNVSKEFEVFAEVIWKDSEITESSPSPLLPESNLQSGLAEFLLNPVFSDVTLVIGEENLFMHKIILASASPVISTMLQSSMREVQENIIEIEDIKLEVMQTVLKFLYTGKTEDLHDLAVALDVLKVAEKYEMLALKLACEQKILDKIKVENVLDIICVADPYNSVVLKDACLTFIKSHKSDVKGQSSFQELFLTQPMLM